MAAASDAYSKYQSCIEAVVSSRATLPHLELLDWEDNIPLRPSFFSALTTSNIQHLKLFRVPVKEEFEVIQPPPSKRWNLRTLNIDIPWDFMCDTRGSSLPIKSPSKLCAQP
jgi:hypothetical protein